MIEITPQEAVNPAHVSRVRWWEQPEYHGTPAFYFLEITLNGAIKPFTHVTSDKDFILYLYEQIRGPVE